MDPLYAAIIMYVYCFWGYRKQNIYNLNKLDCLLISLLIQSQ